MVVEYMQAKTMLAPAMNEGYAWRGMLTEGRNRAEVRRAVLRVDAETILRDLVEGWTCLVGEHYN